MALVQWKQIDPELKDDGRLTGSLSLSGSFFLNDRDILDEIFESGIFRETGSFWNTTRNIGITGSFYVNLDSEKEDTVQVSLDEEPKLEINKQGVFRLFPQQETPDPVDGGFFYSASQEFFLGS
jgi:hypothetical protein